MEDGHRYLRNPNFYALCGLLAIAGFYAGAILFVVQERYLRGLLWYYLANFALCVMAMIMAYRFRHVLWNAPRLVASLLLRDMAPKRHERLVKEFKNLPFTQNEASRSRAMQFLTAVCGSCDYEPYVHQMSHDDQEQQLHGIRTYFWAKDLEAEPVMDPIPENPLHIWVDVDYYVSSQELLATNAPCALYTLTPAHAAYNDNHFAYSFNDAGEIKVQYKRGQCFQHYLWDFSETFAVTTTMFGIPFVRTSYRSMRKPVGPHHSIILIIPIAREYWPIPMFHWLSGEELHGFAAVRDGFAAIRQFGAGGLNVSIARTGAYSDVVLTADQYDGLQSVVATLSSTIRLNAGLVLSHINTLTHSQAAIVADYFTHAHPTPRDVIPGTGATAAYVFDNKPNAYPLVGKLTDICAPLIPGANYDPASCAANDEACIRERLEKIRSSTEATPRVLQYIQEFTKLMIPEPHQLKPQLVEQVYEQQDRPAQRRILDEACATGLMKSQKTVQSFQKAEAYQEPKAPRNISTIRPLPKMWYSAYMYAFVAEILKKQPWYAFGRSCHEVAQRVTNICQGARSFISDTDFSKFDGTVGPVARRLEEQLLLRAFEVKESESVLEWHRHQYGCTGYTKFGLEYDTGDSRLSGSPETSAFNSCLNAFCSYVALRMSDKEPLDAFNGLGLYGGDDGISADIPTQALEKAAKELGLTLKVNEIKRGSRWVTFLARYYSPNVWIGDTNSCCDLKRQLSKLHSTPGQCTDKLSKLVQKIAAFSYTDAESPVFHNLVQCLEKVLGSREELQATLHETDLPYVLQCNKDLGNSYPNHHDEWMDELLQEQVPDADTSGLLAYLEDITLDNVEKLLTMPPICQHRTVLVPVNGTTEGVPHLTLDQKPHPLPERPPRLEKKKSKASTVQQLTATTTAESRPLRVVRTYKAGATTAPASTNTTPLPVKSSLTHQSRVPPADIRLAVAAAALAADPTRMPTPTAPQLTPPATRSPTPPPTTVEDQTPLPSTAPLPQELKPAELFGAALFKTPMPYKPWARKASPRGDTR